MTKALLILFFCLTSFMHAQETDEILVKHAIDTFFDGFHKGDTTILKSVLGEKLILQTVYKDQAGKDILVTEDATKLIQAIANRPSDQKWDERLLSYNIQIDGTMANVWTPYEFWFNGTFSHCGVNSFQLFKGHGAWKIIYLIDTRRREDCQN